MHMSIGIESMVLVREARKATFLALAFSSSLACTSPSTFFWLGQISTHTLNSMIVPSQAPTPMTRMPGSLRVKAATKPEPSPWYMVSSAAALETMYQGEGSGFVAAFTLSDPGMRVIGVGAWLGTIMLFNVWVLIWPNQKKVLGLVQASDEEKAKAKKVAFLASRTNTMLSIPMLMCMTAQGHGLPF